MEHEPVERLRFEPKTLLLFLAAVGLLVAWQPAAAEDLSEQVERIGRLRAEGRFVEARQLLQRIESSPSFRDAPAWFAGDLRRLAITLDAILETPPRERAQLAHADSLTPLIDACYEERRYDEGLFLAREQLGIRDRLLGPDHVETWETRNALGMMIQERGDVLGALELLKQIVTANDRLLEPDHPARDAALSNLATIYDDLGEFALAEPFYRSSLAIARRNASEDPLSLATTLNNLGTNLQSQGDYEDAELLLREALGLRRRAPADAAAIAQSESNLAALLAEDDRPKEALPLFRQAITRREAAGLRGAELAAMKQSFGVVLRENHRYREAEREFRSVVGLRERAAAPRARIAFSRVNLACAERGLGNVANALQILRASVGDLDSTRGPIHPDAIWARRHLGETELSLGDWTGAESTLAIAARGFEDAWRRARPGEGRSAFQTSPYPLLGLALLEQGRGDEAWVALEHYLGRGLIDQLAFEARLRRDSTAWTEVSRRRLAVGRARSALEAQEAKVGGSPTTGDRGHAARDTLEARLAALHRDLLAFEARSDRRSPGVNVSLQNLQAVLAPDEALVGWMTVPYADRHEARYGYVIRSSGGVHWERLHGDRAATFRSRDVERYLAAIRSGDDTDSLSRVVTARRWTPLVPHLEGVRRLIVIPSGDMLGVPLEALLLTSRRRGENVPIVSYELSATLLVQSRLREKKATDGTPSVLAFCDPPHSTQDLHAMSVASASASTRASGPVMRGNTLRARERAARTLNRSELRLLPRLPNAREEGRVLAHLAGPNARVFQGPSCSESELRRLAEQDSLASFRILHFGTHALVNDHVPTRSALILSQMEPMRTAKPELRSLTDGIVTVGDILSEWRLDAELVTLSACATGLGRRVAGEGYVGFTQALRRVGADAVLVSLWNVDDRSTALLMQNFYENWERANWAPNAKGNALAQAKEWLRKGAGGRLRTPHDHPYYWAGFILIGE